jgi:MFS family permease
MTSSTEPQNVSSHESQRGFPFAFWLLNSIEACERLAFYLVWPVVGIYIAQKDDPGGLHRSQEDRGQLVLWFSLVQVFIPIVSGGYADRYGFKLALIISMIVSAVGYGLMAADHSYLYCFVGAIVMGVGQSFFKPAIQGALSRLLTREQSSIGWGIFYWVVNIGAMLGHWVSPLILVIPHTARSYQNLFWVSSGSCIVALLLLLLVFKDIPTGGSKLVSPLGVLVATVRNIFEPRLLAWLLIMSAFWMMMYQLWDSQPNFIQDWIDRGALAHIWPLSMWAEIDADKVARVPQQVLISLNALLIVLFVVPISHFVRKLRSLTAMLGGMFVVTLGMFIAGATQTSWILLAGISFFSLGEMLVGPKKSEYLALIAPPGKKALYLGYVVIPTGVGRGLGNWLSGWLYGEVGEKAGLSLRYLMEKTSFGKGKTWDGRMKSLEAASGVKLTDAFAKLQQATGLSEHDATQMLWNTYHPQYWFWLPFVAVGIIAVIALYIYGRMARRWADMNA